MGGPHGIRGLGEFIRNRRLELEMTQDELAEAIDAPRGYVSQIETGSKRWPAKYVPMLASVLDCSIAELREAAFLTVDAPVSTITDADIDRIANAVVARLTEEKVPA